MAISCYGVADQFRCTLEQLYRRALRLGAADYLHLAAVGPRSSSVSKGADTRRGSTLAAARATAPVPWVTSTFMPALTLVVSVNSVASAPTVNAEGYRRQACRVGRKSSRVRPRYCYGVAGKFGCILEQLYRRASGSVQPTIFTMPPLPRSSSVSEDADARRGTTGLGKGHGASALGELPPLCTCCTYVSGQRKLRRGGAHS